MKRVVVIGGGITGLAAAHRLLERGRELEESPDIILIEAGAKLGGIIQTSERDGFLLERGPDAFVSEKPEALDLAKRIGLEPHLIETNKQNRRSFIVRDGRLLPVPEGFHLLAPARFWPFITSGIFSWTGKARITLDLLLPGRDNGEGDESIADFVRRRFGREALERMAQPMVAGIHTADPEQLSLRATFPKFLEMERRHRSLIRALRKESQSAAVGGGAASRGSIPTVREGVSGARYAMFLSFDRGMQMLVDQLSKELNGVNVMLGTRINSVGLSSTNALANGQATTPKSWCVQLDDGERIEADAVCIALPAYVAANLLQMTDAQLSSELNGIPYASSATINLAYKREDIPHALDGFGFVVPFVERRSLMACTFSSVKFAGRAPEGLVLLRAFVGGALQPELVDLENDVMTSRVGNDLRDLLGIKNAPLFAEVSRWHNSMPQYHLGHLDRVRRIEERMAKLPGLALAGNAYSGIGIPDCIRSGEQAADNLIGKPKVTA